VLMVSQPPDVLKVKASMSLHADPLFQLRTAQNDGNLLRKPWSGLWSNERWIVGQMKFWSLVVFIGGSGLLIG
jgi:hypothetical protein